LLDDNGGRKQLLQFFDAWRPADPATIGARKKLSLPLLLNKWNALMNAGSIFSRPCVPGGSCCTGGADDGSRTRMTEVEGVQVHDK
jgi:Tetratricopeptide repeat